MQSWHPADSSNPFGADPTSPLQAPQRGSCVILSLIILGGGCICFLLCAGGGVYLAYRQNRPSSPLPPAETLQEKIASSTAAYASQETGVDNGTLRKIERLMSRVRRAAHANDDAAYCALVDFKGVMDYVKQSEHAARADFTTLMTLKSQMSASTYVDPLWHQIKIRHVEPIAGTSQFLTYTHCHDADGEMLEVRFWLSNRDETWKIVDWERLDLGLRHSTEWALYAAYADDWQLENYFDVLDDIGETIELPEGGHEEWIANIQKRLQTRPVPPEFRDSCWVLLGYECTWYDDPDSAIRCFNRVSRPDATPGAHYGMAISLGQTQRFAEAIKAMSRYEAVVGPTPDGSRFKAGWLAELDRHDEEAEEWKRVLRFEPDDQEAMRSFANLLDDNEMPTLAPYLARTSEPLRRAETLAETFSYQRNKAGFEAVKQFVRKTAPQSATAAHLAGLQLRDADQLEQAAAKLLEAIELAATTEHKSRYRYLYLDVMVEANLVLEGYNAVDDQSAAFQYLVDDESELVLTEEEMNSLLAAHRKEHPSDTYGAYIEGLRLAEDERYEEAAALLAEGIKRAADDDVWLDACQYALDDALCDSGKCLEAYRAGDMSSERFSALASVCRTQRRWDDLRALLAEHRTHQPDDPSLSFYQAALFVSEENPDEARKLLAKLAHNKGDETTRNPHRYQINRLNSHPDLWQAAYDHAKELETAKSMLMTFANRFSHEGRYVELRSLIAKHRERFPDDTTPAIWHSSLLVTEEDYAEFVDIWLPKLARFFDDEHRGWTGRNAPEQLVRVLLKTGHNDDALDLASRVKEEYQEHLPLIVCHAVAGNIEETCKLIEEHLEDYGRMDELFDDEDIGPLLRSPTYAEFRAQHPFEIPYSIGENELALLCKRLPDWNAAALQTMLSGSAVGPVTVTPLLNDATTSPRFVVASRDARLMIAVHDGKYSGQRPTDWQSGPSRAALDEHTAWVSVAASRWARPRGQRDSRELVRDATLRLLDENCLAIWLVDHLRLLHNNETDRSAWSATATAIEQAQLGEHLQIYRDYAPTEIHSERAVTRALRRLRHAFENRASNDDFVLAIDLSTGSSHERLWITLEEIRGEQHYPQYIGSLLHDSLLAIGLREGERLSIDEYEIVACRFQHAGQTVEAGTNDTASDE